MQASPPVGDELAALAARQRGWNLVPADVVGGYRNTGFIDSPVERFDDGFAMRMYSASMATPAPRSASVPRPRPLGADGRTAGRRARCSARRAGCAAGGSASEAAQASCASNSLTRGTTSLAYSSMLRMSVSCGRVPLLYFMSKRDSPSMFTVRAILRATDSGAPA